MSYIFKKFIIEGENLILSKCTYHKELVEVKDFYDNVKGGGMYKFDKETNTYNLFGKSSDFGYANLTDIQKCIDNNKVFARAYGKKPYDTKLFKFTFTNSIYETTNLN